MTHRDFTARNLSKNDKTVFLIEDFTLMGEVERSRCMLVRQFDYRLSRARDNNGLPYGTTTGSMLTLTINTSTGVNTKALYNLINVTSATRFSIIGNAVYDLFNKLADYDSAMVIEGYIVSINEKYDSQREDGANNNTTMDISILFTDVEYIGETVMNDKGQMTLTKLIRRF